MTEVRDSASLHPKTVTDLSTGAVDLVRRPRSKAAVTRGWLTTLKMNPVLWAKAIDLAEGDRHRIQVISATEVIVHNNRRWRVQWNSRTSS